MRPVIVMPMHDPNGLFFPHLKTITPTLKALFERAFISIPLETRQSQCESIKWVKSAKFFEIFEHKDAVTVGDDFLALYAFAARSCSAQQLLHLCFIDRVAFALQSEHRERFQADIESVQIEHTPLIFQRSVKAWETHPRNYRELEQSVTRAGELLFRKTLDFAWCHLVVQAHRLQQVLPQIKNHDLSIVAELALLMKDMLHTSDVDWLAWEDPFILKRDASQIKIEREQSADETCKRLNYVIPMLKLLKENAQKGDV